VNSSSQKICWKNVIRLLVGAGIVLYVFSRFIPCASVNDYPLIDGLDNAWTQALHLAFAAQWQFGTDMVFTYGPWGFLARGYHPLTYLDSVIAWVILSLVFLGAGWRLARHFSDNRLVAGLWLVAFAAAASLPAGEDFNNRLVAWGVLLLALHFFVEEGVFSLLQMLLVVSLGWLSLVKFTGLLESLLVIAVIAADNVFRQRRFPWIVAAWAGGLLFFWFAAGQHFNLLEPFLVNSWRITSGYTEAMMVTGQREACDVTCFLLMAGLLCALAGRLAWARSRYFGLLPLAGLGMILFIVFKLGYVRNGGQHGTTSATALVLVALACLAVAKLGKKFTAVAAACLLLASVLYAATVFNFWLPGNGLGRQLAGTFSPNQLLAPVTVPFTGYLRNDYENNLAHERTNFSLAPILGNADLYSYDQTVLFAHHVAYQPRPVMQSYSAYTPELAAMNAAHLRGATAADNILFAVQPIDDRFPALEDGRSWLELLTRYDLKGAADKQGKFLLLTRAVVPRKFQLTPLKPATTRFGEPVKLPEATNGPVWVEIEIKKSLAGLVVSTLYKPPVLRLTVVLKNHTQPRFRLVPGLAAAGFLLSPLIADTHAFAALATNGGRSVVAGMEMDSMMISADTSSGTTLCYQSPVVIRFYRLAFPAQPAAAK